MAIQVSEVDVAAGAASVVSGRATGTVAGAGSSPSNGAAPEFSGVAPAGFS